MKKRSCKRFSIPGTTLYYKSKPGLFFKKDYPDQYYPVINLSRGGASFLCNERLKAGKKIVVRLQIPETEQKIELHASVKWISRNPEESYQYRTGIAFNTYGNKHYENPASILELLKSIEQ
ncbi:MAG: PilZ domain-containing protein [Proteobacteria bacterium]|nr:PilZ domain-containing protein [Pseudomonadota bacterium]MBU1388052.1 PilZ domain-containing protein [Pseudomonadota bacterium]MBU1542115.1 PilZ domain-containing protein [Pseudomonadota bacterium]MBU2430099.1 PilZ domain-containing protein [Pseudomonadota bacterium]MBU2482379.1 PilZ domain-containing protein [Pseudomonadota bacterium]